MFTFFHRSYLGGTEGTTDTDEKKHHRGGMDRALGTYGLGDVGVLERPEARRSEVDVLVDVDWSVQLAERA